MSDLACPRCTSPMRATADHLSWLELICDHCGVQMAKSVRQPDCGAMEIAVNMEGDPALSELERIQLLENCGLLPAGACEFCGRPPDVCSCVDTEAAKHLRAIL